MISKGRLVRLLHVAAAQLGLPDEQYRGLLRAKFPAQPWKDADKPSSLDLSQAQASELLDELHQMGFKLLYKGPVGGSCSPCERRGDKDVSIRPADDVVYAVTPGQEADIKQLRANITWAVPNGFNRWLIKRHAVFKVEDSLTASRVIAALRAMCQKEHACSYCGIDARRGTRSNMGDCPARSSRPLVAPQSAPVAKRVYYLKSRRKTT